MYFLLKNGPENAIFASKRALTAVKGVWSDVNRTLLPRLGGPKGTVQPWLWGILTVHFSTLPPPNTATKYPPTRAKMTIFWRIYDGIFGCPKKPKS